MASRRRAEELIRAGRVTVNGRVARLGQRADPNRDVVAVDGRHVHGAAPRYWLAHKPSGVLTTRRDPRGRPTVLDLLPEEEAVGLFPVGRLDLDSEGLVLLTNDGETTHVLLHPSLENEREYRVTVRGRLEAAKARQLGQGLVLGGRRTAPTLVGRRRFDRSADTTTFHLTLREGRKRQIRRMLVALGHPVVRLVRIRMGPLVLRGLARGRARPLQASEQAALRRHARRLRARHEEARKAGERSRRMRARGPGRVRRDSRAPSK